VIGFGDRHHQRNIQPADDHQEQRHELGRKFMLQCSKLAGILAAKPNRTAGDIDEF
jgi:hypothetical protein